MNAERTLAGVLVVALVTALWLAWRGHPVRLVNALSLETGAVDRACVNCGAP